MSDQKYQIVPSFCTGVVSRNLVGVMVAEKIKIPLLARFLRLCRFMIHAIWWALCVPFLFIKWGSSFGAGTVHMMQVLPFYGFIAGVQLYFLWEAIPYPRLNK
tara:strand:+ start:1621 stop:1929 length:309 start_codon:yes stop_codon:yes gene_type:complete